MTARPRPVSVPLVAAALLGAVTLWTAPAAALDPADVKGMLDDANRALDDWQLDKAATIAQQLEAALPDVPFVQELVGRVKFHEGDFVGAVKHLERAIEGGADPAWAELARSTLDETSGSVPFTSDHFVVRTPAGKDELLGPIALDALEKAFAAVAAAFAYEPTHKIAVDILHDARGLASVSTLTVKEIETSGTIALCKFNRLMITSPKALARGYSWLDTLSHELVHLIISEKSHNQVPIWLHEGLAKYSESLWRGAPGLAIGPASENVLAEAVKKGKLITFEQMHPSMAKLPSQHDTALAFAEVFTVIEHVHTLDNKGRKSRELHDMDGFSATNRLLDELARRQSMDDALRASVGLDLKKLQRSWKRYLKKRRFRVVPGAQPRALKFVKNARGRNRTVDEQEEEAALEEAGSREGRRYVRLGNLLYRKGRLQAATVEFEKAIVRLGARSPATHNRLAGLYLELKRQGDAERVLKSTLNAFPDDPQTHVLLGRSALRREDWPTARRHYERATWENPFNPEIWAGLRIVGEKTADAQLKQRAENALLATTRHVRAATAATGPTAIGKNGAFGTLTVKSTPWGAVWLDGVALMMSTPLTDLRVKPGVHRVRVHDEATGQQAVADVEIEAGRAARVEVTLGPVTPDQLQAWIAEETEMRGAPTDIARGSEDGGATPP